MSTSPKSKKMIVALVIIASALPVLMVLALVAARVFFFGVYRIPQNGMYPGLPAGSRFFTARHAYASASTVKRGDVVVFIHEEKGLRYDYIWRVIALPGDTIIASGEALSVNGQVVKRQRIREVEDLTIYREQLGDASYEVAFPASPTAKPPDVSLTVPPGQFFVMGDNRFNAVDSRYFGPISFGSIIGKKL